MDLVRPRARRPGPLFRSACRNADQRLAPLGRSSVRFTFQPSEIAKVAAVFFLAWWFARYEKASGNLIFTVSSFRSRSSALLLALIVSEVDLGTTALIGATMFVIMFVAGTNPVAARIAFVRRAWRDSLRRDAACRSAWAGSRLSCDPESFKQDAGLQQMQALIAWGSGGMEGLGLGNGRQKMLYLPYAHTDFIFPMIGEELGLRVSLLVVFLFVVIIVCGMMIALHAKDRFGLLLGCGIVSLLGLAGSGEHRRHHFALAEQGIAAAIHQLRRIESGRLPFWSRIAPEHLPAGQCSRPGLNQETDDDHAERRDHRP